MQRILGSLRVAALAHVVSGAIAAIRPHRRENLPAHTRKSCRCSGLKGLQSRRSFSLGRDPKAGASVDSRASGRGRRRPSARCAGVVDRGQPSGHATPMHGTLGEQQRDGASDLVEGARRRRGGARSGVGDDDVSRARRTHGVPAPDSRDAVGFEAAGLKKRGSAAKRPLGSGVAGRAGGRVGCTFLCRAVGVEVMGKESSSCLLCRRGVGQSAAVNPRKASGINSVQFRGSFRPAKIWGWDHQPRWRTSGNVSSAKAASDENT